MSILFKSVRGVTRRRQGRRMRIGGIALVSLAAAAIVMLLAGIGSASKGVLNYFGNPSSSTSTLGGQFSTASSGVGGVGVNKATGNVYVADRGNNRIEEFNASGGFIRAWGESVVSSGPDKGNEIQSLAVSATAGNFVLTFKSESVAHEIPFNASAATVQAELEKLTSIGSGNVLVSGGPGNASGSVPYSITFVGARANKAEGAISVTNGTTPLSGGTGASSGTVNPGAAATGFEVCNEQVNQTDVCKAGVTTVATAGAMSTPQGVVVNQETGNVYVTDQGFLRVDEFSANGGFIRSWGQEVVSSGPDLVAKTSAVQSVTVTATGGDYKLQFEGQTSGELAYNATATEMESVLAALSTIGSGNVKVTFSAGVYTVTFQGTLANVRLETMSVINGATPPSGGTVTVATTTQGASGFDVCSASGVSSVADVCKTGVTGAAAGAFATTFSGYPAVAPAGASNAGDVLVGDPGNRRVQEFGPAGVFVRAFGDEVVASGPDKAAGFDICTAASFDVCTVAAASGSGIGQFATSQPTRVAEDATGAIYTVEATVNFRVQKFTPPVPYSASTLTPSAFATSTLTGSAATSTPTDVAVDPTNNNVYVVKAYAAGTGVPPATVAERRVLQLSPAGELLETDMVGAAINSVNGIAENPTTGRMYVSSTTGAQRLYILDNVSAPGVALHPTTEVRMVLAEEPNGGAATLNGIVEPAAEPNGGLETSYQFEYSANGSTWTKAPASPVALGNGSGSGSPSSCPTGNPPVCEVSQGITGLEPNQTYQMRLTATKAFAGASATSPTQSFTTPAIAPVVFATLRPIFSAASATLTGYVNPENSPTTYYFEYGPTTSYGTRTPVESEPSIGSGGKPALVTASVSGLEPSHTYHFRVIASNPSGTTAGPDEAFTTAVSTCPNEAIREQQGLEVLALPDCMALEQVSPANKHNQFARQPSRISAGGSRIVFSSIGDLDPTAPDYNGIGGDDYLASRSESAGWETEGANLPYGSGGGVEASTQVNFSPDLSSWLQLVTLANGSVQFLREGVGHSFSALSPPLKDLTEPYGPEFQGSSADLSHVYFVPQYIEGLPTGTFMAGDPLPEGTGMDPNLYVSHIGSGGQPELELVARDREGKVWGANCGARLGGVEPISGIKLNLQNGYRNQGAISADGSRVYFSTRPGQLASGNCTEANKKRIMVRDETPTGPTISELFQSECTRVSPACSVTGDDIYQGASVDQTKVYFTTTRQLANSDLDSGTACSNSAGMAGCDLYLYDSTLPAGHQLVQVSAGETNVHHESGAEAKVYNDSAAISADGSRVYFVAAGALTEHANPEGVVAEAGKPNFYTWDASTGHISFIGVLNTGDGGATGLWGSRGGTWNANGAYPVPIAGSDAEGHEIGGDGHILLFKSKASLTTNDTDGGRRDIYRYNSTTEELTCVSCRPGSNDSEPFEANTEFGAGPGASGTPGTDYSVAGRPISEDGETIEFITTEGLLPAEASGLENIYLWRGGQIYHIPGSALPPKSAINWPELTPDGSELAYHTVAQLLPSDGDSVLDVYALRVDGGYQEPQPVAVCVAEACQQHSAKPNDQSTASESFTGPGNVLLVQQLEARKVVTSKKLTRAQKLANALKACRKESKRRRSRCEALARKRYGSRAKSKKRVAKTKKSSGKGSK